MKIWFQNRRMKWKRTKKGGKGERKEGEEGEEGKQEMEKDLEGEEEEEDNIQVDSPPPDMDDLNNSNSLNLQSPSSSSPPHFEIKSETPDQHHLPPPALNPFYLPAGKMNNFTSFPSHSTFSTASFPTNAFANQHLGLKPRDLREAFNLARRPEAEAEVAESR